MQAFLKIVGDLKAVDKEANKMYAFCHLGLQMDLTGYRAAFSCIGDIMAVFGAQVHISVVFHRRKLMLTVHVLYG